MTKVSLDLSIIILPGSNIRNLHKLILNIEDSLKRTQGSTYELLLNDSADITHYLKKYPNQSAQRYADSEPFASIRGKNTIVFEVNSLVSPNWIRDALAALGKNSKNIFHTQATIFTTKNRGHYIWTKLNSDTPDTKISLAIKNQWDFPMALDSSLLSPLAYTSLWAFTEKSIHEGIGHHVIPESASFKRETPLSTSLPVVHYSPLYDSLTNEKKTPDESENHHTESTVAENTQSLTADVKETLRRGHVWMKRRSKIYKAVVMPILQGNDERQAHKKIPEWAIQSWKDVHVYDRTVFPTREAVRALHTYTTLSVGPGLLLQQMLGSIEKLPNYIFLSQHMMKGGGDKVVLNYIKAMLDSKPDWKILLIVTEEFNNTWVDQIPKGVDYIDFGQLAKRFDITTRYILLRRLIAQLQTKKMLFAMTPFGFEMIEHYAESLIEQKYQLDAVAFCSDTDKFGRTWGIHFFGIPETFPALHKIVTDNQHVIDETTAMEPLSKDKFAVHYQPVEYTLKEPAKAKRRNGPIRILWASRVANQKRPDIVIEIAKKLDPKHFIIDMFGNLEDDYTEKDFVNIPALNYRGGFNGLNSLPTSEYDALLYTSSFDGIPNILLEATALGLPLIAPRVGGIDEFVKDKKTGLLIDEIEDIEAFVAALAYFEKHPEKAHEMVVAAQKLINSQHSYAGFKAVVERDLIIS